MSTFTKEPHTAPKQNMYKAIVCSNFKPLSHTPSYRNRGFSMVELSVVLVILLILASIAVPNYNKYVVRARQNEARTYLLTFFYTFRARFAETGSYLCNGLCGFVPPDTSPRRYMYRAGIDTLPRSAAFNTDTCASFGSPSPTKSANIFRVSATANIDNDTFCDIMSITHTGRLESIQNDALQ
jgi:prepilin-type N-terminal cleavage/methylation domain-containing protein